MKIVFNTELLAKSGVTIGDFAYMLCLYADSKPHPLELKDKGLLLLSANMSDGPHYTISNEGKALVEDIITQSETKADVSKLDRWDLLADRMRALFPQGKKPGTNYMWKDSTQIIAKKLRVWYKKYKAEFTDDEIIDATKRYVESFNGNYQYMQLLKYFISKQVIVDGSIEENSQLLSYLQNTDEDNHSNDWQTELR